MASPTTLPTLQVQEGQLYVLRKGVSTIIGQAVRVQPQSNVPTRKIPRLGDTNKATSYQPAEHSVSIEIYAERDPAQMAQLLGGSTKPVSGGWAGTEELRLNPTVAAFDLFVDVYETATGSGDVLAGTWTLDNFKPSSLSVPVQADNVVTHTINGEIDDLYYTPAAGYGNADLSGLVVSAGSIVPAFAVGTTSYTLSVANGVTSTTVTPTAAGKTITVNGVTVASGAASGAIALAVGANTITVVVTVSSGATKTYTVTVTRAAP